MKFIIMFDKEIIFQSENIYFVLEKEENLKLFIETIINENGKQCGEWSYIFCSDDYLLDINKKHLEHDYYTDVITFDYCEEKKISGDIFISIDRVEENSKKYNVSFDNELLRIIFHGLLHLLGFDDKTKDDKELMTKKEDYYLKEYLKFDSELHV